MREQKWTFDPTAPEKIPPFLHAALEAHGVCREQVKLVFPGDYSPELFRLDFYGVATGETLYLLGGIMTLSGGDPAGNSLFEKLGGRRRASLQSSFRETFYEEIPLSSLSDCRVEESASHLLLRAGSGKDGGRRLLARASFSLRQEMQYAAKYLNALLRDGEIVPDKDYRKKELCCPKCGNRYADPDRKFCPKCQDKRMVIGRMAVFLRRYKGKIALTVLMMLLTGALGIVAPYFSSTFYYDQVLDKAGNFYGELLTVLLIIISTRLLSTFFSSLHSIVSSKIAASLSYDMKKTIFSAIERLSVGFFTSRQTGGLMTQVTGDSETIYWFFCDCIPFILVNSVQILCVVTVMFLYNWRLALISLSAIPPAFLCIRLFYANMRRYHNRRFSRQRSMNSFLSDVLNGMRVVKAFAREQDETKRFSGKSKAAALAAKASGVYSSTHFPIVDFLIYLGNILVWGFGGWMVITGSEGMTYGVLLGFLAYMNIVYAPMYGFSNMIQALSDSVNAMSRLIEIMDAVPEVPESEHPVPVTIEGDVTFRDVSFSYTENRRVLKNISFHLEKGKTLGIVGHTGSGKSTLVNLLMRLYDVQEGEILIDGVNVKEIASENLRKSVAIVSQETYLFVGTIKENIAYAKPDARDEEIIAASRIAGAHDFIMKLPDAYSTRVGFGGKSLSGGERQRISIARAILRDPKILILDEATAAMDTETERRIQLALEQLTKGRTTIMIAHRLSTLRAADSLIVIERGELTEAGTHDELIRKKGDYYTLYKLQMEAMRNIGVGG